MEPAPPSAPQLCLAVRSTVVMPCAVATLDLEREENRLTIEAHSGGDAPLLAVPLLELDGQTTPEKLARVGCLCRVLDRTALAGGGVRVVLQGLRRVHLRDVRFEQGRLLASTAEPTARSYDDRELTPRVERVLTLAHELARVDPRCSPELARMLGSETGAAGRFADVAAARLHLSYADRTELLVEQDVLARLERLGDLLGRDIARAEVLGALQHKVDERLRRGLLREQLSVIQGELGDGDALAQLARDLRERLEAAALPASARRAVQRELEHLERGEGGPSDLARSREWIEWVLELPWHNTTRDPDTSAGDSQRVAATLDLALTGLDEVKERLAEFLAVRRLSGSTRGGVLAFVGPPGTGKTSMARAVAQALGRRLAHIHVGGAADGEELEGRARTLAGGGPGRVLAAVARSGVRNPVVLLDEVDKAHWGGWNRVTRTLLTLVDPEGAREFTDAYLGVPFDLSECLLLLTANELDALPHALVDRLELVHFGSYTEAEKLLIAREHILPRAREAAGLAPHDFQVTRAALVRVLRSYAVEPGVRQLQRTIDALARKAAVSVLNERRALRVDQAQLTSLLGPPMSDPFLHHDEPRVGVVLGLAWTNIGGALLPIETLVTPGAGRVTLTGSLGEVMRESVQTALSWVRMRLPAFEIPADALETRDIHVHFPSGATPKDGPSAGTAIAVSLISVITGVPVRHDVALTGEMSLHGVVLPVGGLREKLLAALRSGLRTVIVPARNSEDVLQLPREVRQRLEIRLVEHVSEVFNWALVDARASNRPQPAPETPHKALPRRSRREKRRKGA
ncbi:MAG: endopeptidase La [Planctomycetes bacterium]|nr:endopeptidase La [Planctomycetota bacterium]